MNIPEKLQERYGKSHLSYSSLKVALSDMAKFDQYMKGELKFESPALSFGTLYDMLLFERDKAMDSYVVVNEQTVLDSCSSRTVGSKSPKMTKEYKEKKAELELKLNEENKTIVSPEDWKKANEMIDRLDASGLSGRMLKSNNYQVEFKEMIGNVQVKGFLDCLGDGFIVDSKSTQSVNKFRYSVRDFSYDIQAYIYCKVFGVDKFYWLVQEKSYPYLPGLVECSEETLFAGEMKFNQAVQRIESFLGSLDAGASPMQDYVQFKV